MPRKSPETAEQIGGLLRIYGDTIHPLLKQLSPDRVEELDAQAKKVLAARSRLGEQITICFLGRAGVGKSTLINALAAGKDLILPSGGIGTLTAQATKVVFSEVPRFTVKYHSQGKLNQVAFGLRKIAEALSGRGASEAQAATLSDERIASDLENEDTKSETRDGLLKQARLLVKGHQDGDATAAYLADCLSHVLDHKPAFGSQILPEDAQRLERIKAAGKLGSQGQEYICAKDSNPEFSQELKNHATGFLSPLIEELEVGWPSQIAKAGIELVDLPGVGVFNDLHKQITEGYVRQKARAVVLVVDRSGADQASAELLISSGFLYRLLHSADSPEVDPVLLLVVAVAMDLVAAENYARERQDRPQAYRKKAQHLLEVRDQMRSQLQHSLGQLLSPIVERHSSRGGIVMSGIVERVVQSTSYHAVSTTEYRKHVSEDEDDKAFITDPSQSGIPALCRAVLEEVSKHQQTLLRRAIAECHAFGNRLEKELEVLRAERKGGLRDREALARLREEFRLYREQREKELAARSGAFREFLREGIVRTIEGLVRRAASEAYPDFTRYLRTLGEMHHSTLLASLKKGGVHSGVRRIDLPTAFAQIIETQLAPLWNDEVVKQVRQRTKELAEAYAAILEEFQEWISKQGLKEQAPLVGALCDQIRADAAAFAGRGHEGSEELRAAVRDGLYGHLRGAIEEECLRFVQADRHRGTGAKARALDFCEDLIPKVIKVSEGPATRLLKDAFTAIEADVRSVFEQHSNPLKKVAEVLFDTQEQRHRIPEKDLREQLSAIEAASRALEGLE